jgi:hypothetical protein
MLQQSQFESFVNYHLSKVTLNYKFKVKFEGTEYDREDRIVNSLTDWQNGILTPQLSAARGLTVKEFNNSIGMMQSLGFPEKMKPIQTSHTMNGDEKKSGRPEGKGSSESKDITIDADSNADKGEE